MKIGPLDIGIKTLAFTAGIVVVAMLDLKMVISNNTTRAEGYYSTRIPEYLMSGIQHEYDDGLKQCDVLLRVLRGHVPTRLYRATYLYHMREFEQAKDGFRSVSDDRNATPQYRAMGSFGVGSVIFMAVPDGERPKAALEATEWYLKALKSDAELTDAKVGLLTAALWCLSTVDEKKDTKETQAVYRQVADWMAVVLKQEAEKDPLTEEKITALLMSAVESVEKERRPPTLDSMSLFYNAKGLVLGRASRAVEANEAFNSAQSVRLRWDAPALNQWRTAIKLLPEAKMKLTERETLLNQCQQKLTVYPKDFSSAISALGIGWYRMKDLARTEEFQRRYLPKAMSTLRQGYDKGDPLAMMNAIAILDERLFGSADKGGLMASVSSDFLLPFPPRQTANPWVVKGNEPRTTGLAETELRKTLQPISDAATMMCNLLEDCNRKVRLDAKKDTELKLRMLACKTIMALTSAGPGGAQKRLDLIPAIEALKAQASDDPNVLNAYAYFMLCAGNFVEAGKAIRRSFEIDPNNEEVKRLNSLVSTTPAFIKPRPSKTGWFGSRALVRVTLLSPDSPGGISSGEMSFDGQNVEARIIGSQLVYLLPDGRLTDGKHTVKANAMDGYGNMAESTFEFGVDKVPPTVMVEPAPGSEVSGPLPQWTIKVSDESSGVDFSSIQVRMTNVGTGSTPCRSLLVDNGIYSADFPGATGKRGDRVDSETFKVASVINLTPGQYELSVTFTDQAGNKRTQSWTYQVK